MHLLVFFIPNQPTVISIFNLLSFLCLFAHPPDCLLLSHPLSHLLPPSLFRSLHLPLLPRVSPLLSHLVPLPSSDLPLFFQPRTSLSLSSSSAALRFVFLLLRRCFLHGFSIRISFSTGFSNFFPPVGAACAASLLQINPPLPCRHKAQCCFLSCSTFTK